MMRPGWISGIRPDIAPDTYPVSGYKIYRLKYYQISSGRMHFKYLLNMYRIGELARDGARITQTIIRMGGYHSISGNYIR